MTHELHVGDLVRLPPPFSDVIGRVIWVFGEGDDATAQVEYVLLESDPEPLTKGFRAAALVAA